MKKVVKQITLDKLLEGTGIVLASKNENADRECGLLKELTNLMAYRLNKLWKKEKIKKGYFLINGRIHFGYLVGGDFDSIYNDELLKYPHYKTRNAAIRARAKFRREN